MALANAKPNALAIAALGMREGESLLELGCGPGRALQGSASFAACSRGPSGSTGPRSCSPRQRGGIGGLSRLDVWR